MNWKLVLLNVIILFMLAACAQQENLDNINTANLAELENIRVQPLAPSNKKIQESKLRIRILKETAMSLGAQGGLAWASDQMNAHLNLDKKYLDSIYNFDAMVLSHGVIPPVLEMGDNSLNLDDPNTIRVADRTYKIVKQARFATTPPNWREYLRLTYSKPQLPDKTLMPRDSFEQKIWKKGLREGWEKGISQATNIFQQNLAMLKRDFRGMILYRKLLQEKMISPPFVARTELGVTGNGTDMRINDQVLRIVELPQLQTNSRGWKAVVVQNYTGRDP